MHIFKLTKTQLGIGGARFRYTVYKDSDTAVASYDDSRHYVAALVFANEYAPKRPATFTVRNFTARPDSLTTAKATIENPDLAGVALIETDESGRAIMRIPPTNTAYTEALPVDWRQLPAFWLAALGTLPDTRVDISPTPKKALTAAAKESPAESLLRTLRERVGGSDKADDPDFVERLDGILRPYVAKTFLAETFRQYLEMQAGELYAVPQARRQLNLDLDEIARKYL